jgi:hypothetical protein
MVEDDRHARSDVMGGEPPRNPKSKNGGREAPAPEPRGDSAFAGNKPGRNGTRPLTDEEAFAELHRRQQERARRR